VNDLLAQLYAAKAAASLADEAREPFEEVEARARSRRSERRGFRKALETARGFGIIAEIKHASPSLGEIVPNFDPAAMARAYARAGVDAVSVLTAEFGFHGDIRHLDLVRAETRVPLLRKDFLTTPYQIAQAAAYGADAVLLIVAGLDDGRLRELIEHAARYDLDVLLEVHDEREAERACAVGARLVGINNRDLRDFSVDLAVTERLARACSPEALIVSESGIAAASDIARLLRVGARAFLIGEAMMRSGDPSRFAAELRTAAP
jgi:indole-3-glycerol phosphate synthase